MWHIVRAPCTLLNQNCMIMLDYIKYQSGSKFQNMWVTCVIVSTDKKRSYVKEQYVCPSKHANLGCKVAGILDFFRFGCAFAACLVKRGTEEESGGQSLSATLGTCSHHLSHALRCGKEWLKYIYIYAMKVQGQRGPCKKDQACLISACSIQAKLHN